MTTPASLNATLRNNGNGVTSQPSERLGRRERVAPLLPAERGREGRPAGDNRVVVNGILWHLRSGAPWREMPSRCGKWNSVYRRYSRWKQTGVWAPVARMLSQVLGLRGDCECGCAEHARPEATS